MTLPNPTNGTGNLIPIANTGVQANQDNPFQTTTKINNAVAALLANDVNLDTRLAVLEASNPPPAAYVTPTPTALFSAQYSGNQNPWTTATMQTRAQFGSPSQAANAASAPTANSPPPVWAYPLSVGNTASGSVNTVLVCWYVGMTTTGNAMNFAIVTIDQSGNQTIGNVLSVTPVPLTGQNANASTGAMYCIGGVAISATVIKVTICAYIFNGSSSVSFDYVINLTYDGSSSLTAGQFTLNSASFSAQSPNQNSGYGANSGQLPASYHPDSYLVGSNSVLLARRQGLTAAGPQVLDRTTQSAFNMESSVGLVDYSNYFIAPLGNSQFVEVFRSYAVTDQTTLRLTARISTFNDNGDRISTASYRLPSIVCSTITGVVPYSTTLFEVQWTDSGSNKRVSLFSIANGAPALIGTYTGNNLSVLPLFVQLFSSLQRYGISAGGSLNQFLFSPVVYNPNASQPGTNDLTGTGAAISYLFGNIASAVQSTLRNVIRLTPNQLFLAGYGGTSSTKTVITETVGMS